MPTIDGIGAVPGAPQQQPPSGLGGLDSDAFLRLLVAQMRYQDPMAPADHTAMLQQTTQFTQVEALQQVTKMQQQLLGLSQAGIAADLVGKDVAASDLDGNEVSGTVRAVRFTSIGPVLEVGGHEVPLEAATEIRQAGQGTAGVASLPADAPEPWQGPWFHDDPTG